ncbi:hypothetical protein ACTFIW_000822 [Dictyostelium discoideum]
MAHIKRRYPTQLAKFIQASLYHTGLHSKTKPFSTLKGVESDDVWKSTAHLIMKAIAQVRGKRAGENKMPAITIPYDKYRYLDTTINADLSCDDLNEQVTHGIITQQQKSFNQLYQSVNIRIIYLLFTKYNQLILGNIEIISINNQNYVMPSDVSTRKCLLSMPLINIPHRLQRMLRTTGSSTKAIRFRH